MAKKKQSKTSWRKRGAPLEDAALQARRQANQERRTGGSMAGLSDSALFDLQPRAGVPKAVIGHRRAPTGDASSKTLWVDRAVAPNKHVPTVVKGQTPTTRETALTGQKRMLKSKIAKVAKGLTQQRAQRALATAAAAAAADGPAAESLDLWGSTAVAPAVGRLRSVSRRAPEASTTTAAVQVPTEGASWNPTAEAHQELLSVAIGHEVERLRRQKLYHRSNLVAHSDDEEEEENAGGAEGDEGEEEEEYHDDVDGERPNWHVDREKLTTAQRNKRARQRAREQEEREAKAKRRREKQLERVDSLLGEIKNEGKHLRTKQAKEAAIEVARPKKLGGKRHVPPRPDVLLTEEQPSALRQLATEGSLLGERFDSMQARNLIEVRAKQPRRSHKGPRRTIPAEIGKALRYKSPHYKGPLPAWL